MLIRLFRLVAVVAPQINCIPLLIRNVVVNRFDESTLVLSVYFTGCGFIHNAYFEIHQRIRHYFNLLRLLGKQNVAVFL